MTEINMIINKSKFQHFDEILKACDGRYLANPFILQKSVVVYFDPGDYDKFYELWGRIEKLKIVEKNNINKIRTFFNRIKSAFKN